MSDIGISIVVPVYNSEACVEELVNRLAAVLDEFGKACEIVLVNDCSTDHSWEKISGLCQTFTMLRGINLRKNFGQDCAIMAGLKNSSGQIVVIMDDDLQHDPRDIPALITEVQRGNDICYALFPAKKHTRFKNFGSWFMGQVEDVILKKPKHIYLSPFKAIRREVIDNVLQYDGPYPFIDGLLLRVTRNITQVSIEHHERYAGSSTDNLINSIKIWSRLATNFSIIPLRLATLLGFVSSGIGLILGLFFLIQYFIGVKAPVGWFSTIVVVLFLGGIQLLTIGIIGEYVGRLFLHTSKEPQFIVKEKIGY